ncbi:MAG: hypothetical protein HYU60_03310 [Magnetospirillum sp.]|nr:hypothetical protein [Magnetospirillum sp.]
MFRKIALVALPVLVLGLGGTARAAPQCDASIKEVQAQWDKMYPMGMDSPKNAPYRTATDNFRIAKEKCKAGKTTEVEQYLNVVRAHLNMPEHTVPHDRK